MPAICRINFQNLQQFVYLIKTTIGRLTLSQKQLLISDLLLLKHKIKIVFILLFYVITEMGIDNEDQTNKRIVMAIISMPDGKKYEIPLVSKTFSSGRQGFYSQIPSFVFNNEVYGGQIQVWKKGDSSSSKSK
ncbi:MAG TPA: hypothetical protein VE524_04740 [Nitrososphaeraceae archaeon]|nr:hypothetical protein [Nitrososphaeraceae archaeon]